MSKNKIFISLNESYEVEKRSSVVASRMIVNFMRLCHNKNVLTDMEAQPS